VVRALHVLGFREVRQRGSHLALNHPAGLVTVVPIHPSEEIGRGLLRKIIRDAEIDVDEFLEKV
jgi:predicted RNA binding protein YcfA (HicA-like mRNA interferase family)